MKPEPNIRKAFRRLGAIRVRQSIFTKPIAIALVISLLPTVSWLEGQAGIKLGPGAQAFQSSAQITIVGCNTPSPANAILQSYCPDGKTTYIRDLYQFEADSVAAYLALHNLPSSDGAIIYQYGRSDLRNEIRGAMLTQLVAIAQKSADKRTAHETKLYQWLQAVVQQNEIANDTAALNEYQNWLADPCHFQLDPAIAKQYQLSYLGAPYCNPLNGIFGGPLAPAESYFRAYGLAKSYGKPAETYPDFGLLVSGTQLAVSEQLAIAFGSGALLAAGAAASVGAFASAIFPYALGAAAPEFYVGGGVWATAAASDVTATSAAAGPAAIVLIAVAIGVAAGMQVFDSQKTTTDLNDLGRLLNEAKATPPDLNAFANDASGLGEYKLNQSFVAQTLPEVASTASLPSWQPGLAQFSIAPSGGTPAAATSFSYQDWNGLQWTVQNWSSSPDSTGWFVQNCTSASGCPSDSSRISEALQYLDWNGVKYTASRFGQNFVQTKASPDSQDRPCPVDANTGVTPAGSVEHCLTYTSRNLRLRDASGGDAEIALSQKASFITPRTFSFTTGQPGVADVIAVGTPTPTLTEVSGPRGYGIDFVPTSAGHAQIRFSGTTDTKGSFLMTLSASNAPGTQIRQDVTVVVSDALQITSSPSLNVTFGLPVNFKVTTTGLLPMTLTPSKFALLNGLTFTDNKDGTATIQGTPQALGGGFPSPPCVLYQTPCTITASNATGSTTQAFNLTGTFPPTPHLVTASANFAAGKANSALLTTSGAITPVQIFPGAFPSWLTLTDNHDGTAWLQGTPPIQPPAPLPLTIVLRALGADVSADRPNFTLSINALPVFTSPATAVATVGKDQIIPIESTGSIVVLKKGFLPKGLILQNGSSARIIGTPAPGTGGLYPLTIGSANEYGTSEQLFTLEVDEAPKFAGMDSTVAYMGYANTINISTTGYPITSEASLPLASPSNRIDGGKGMTFTFGNTPGLSGNNLNAQGYATGTFVATYIPTQLGPVYVPVEVGNGVGTAHRVVTLYVEGRLGDVNMDGIVDCRDYDLVRNAYGSVRGDSRYQVVLDVNNDGHIDDTDLTIIATNSGQFCP